jgi:hypothetical protein
MDKINKYREVIRKLVKEYAGNDPDPKEMM